MIDEPTEEYLLEHISPEPPLLKKLARRTNLRHLYSRMCSGHLQGRMLRMFTAMVNPRRILELGAFTGYSTLCFAEGSSPDTKITTVEIDDEIEDWLRETFAEAGYTDKIDLIIGDAIDILPCLEKGFDLIFIDANKRHYPKYLELVLPLLNPGGFILADNTLWDGKVAQYDANDAQTAGIRKFNDMVASAPELQTVIIPVRDGLTIIQKIGTEND